MPSRHEPVGLRTREARRSGGRSPLVGVLVFALCAFAGMLRSSAQPPPQAAPPRFPTREETRETQAQYRRDGGTESLVPTAVRCPGGTVQPPVECLTASIAAARLRTREILQESDRPNDAPPEACPALTYVQGSPRGPLPNSGFTTVGVFSAKATTRARRHEPATCCYVSRADCPWQPRPNE